MYEKLLSEFLFRENIKYYSFLPLEKCTLLYPRKLPEFTRSVCFFLIPYFVRDSEERNLSLYAVPRDYHLYVKEFEERLLDAISSAPLSAKVFADNSPFDERSCARLAGLGDISKNRLLVNSEYGSYVFIGSICLSCNISITQRTENFKCDLCENCEKCRTACPFLSGRSSECLSAITQKKRITEEESKIISSQSLKWGCDICQEVCPYNKGVPETPIEFFKEKRVPFLTGEILSSMSEEDFSERAYSWRGREVIKRNLEL